MRHVVVMVATSYPQISGRRHRQLHGADRQGRGRARARGPSRRAVASGHHARKSRRRRLLPFLSLRARAVAERVRIRLGVAGGHRRAERRLGRGAARARRRRVQGVARGREEARHRDARPLGRARRRDGEHGPRLAAARRQRARIGRLSGRAASDGAARGPSRVPRRGARHGLQRRSPRAIDCARRGCRAHGDRAVRRGQRAVRAVIRGARGDAPRPRPR